MINKVVSLLEKKNYTISSVESFTVGGFATTIGSISGISKVYKGSLVCYQTSVKEAVLKVDASLVERYGVVSKEIAEEMARCGQCLFDSDICISFTGNAGPTPMENKPVGLIYIGVAIKDNVITYEYNLNGDRETVCLKAVELGIESLYHHLKLEANS